MSKIFRPILPPKDGYVEVLDENGEHVYEPTPETLEKIKMENEMKELKDAMYSLLGVNE